MEVSKIVLIGETILAGGFSLEKKEPSKGLISKSKSTDRDILLPDISQVYSVPSNFKLI